MKLHATNLSPRVTEQGLREAFERYGRVFAVELSWSTDFGHTFGAALIEMNFAEGLSAARSMNGQAFQNRRMYISVCR